MATAETMCPKSPSATTREATKMRSPSAAVKRKKPLLATTRAKPLQRRPSAARERERERETTSGYGPGEGQYRGGVKRGYYGII